MFGIVRALVNIVIAIIDFFLLLRFIFKFFVVNAASPFVAWIYRTSAPLASPFAKIVPDLKFGSFVVDFTTLIALIVYVLAGYLILQIFSYASPRYHRDNGDYRG
ncbi:MAG: YggT family protein [Candidatus Moranbacteria bacterium]|nr:YggT family protein [Candidatus Moranbacteria bacterium]